MRGWPLKPKAYVPENLNFPVENKWDQARVTNNMVGGLLIGWKYELCISRDAGTFLKNSNGILPT